MSRFAGVAMVLGLVLVFSVPAAGYVEIDREGYVLPDFGGQPMKYCFLLLGLEADVQILLVWDGANTFYGDFDRDKVIVDPAEKRILSSAWPPVTIANVSDKDGRGYSLSSYLPYDEVMMRTTVTFPGWSARCVFGTLDGGAYNHIKTWGDDIATAGVEWQGGPCTRLWPRDRLKAPWAPWDAKAGDAEAWPQYPATEYGANCYSAGNYCPGMHPVWGPEMVLHLPSGDLVSRMTNFCACGGAIGATSVVIPADTPTGAYPVTTNLAYDDANDPDEYACRTYWDSYQGFSGTAEGYLLVHNDSGLLPAPPEISNVQAERLEGDYQYPTVKISFTTQTLTIGAVRYGESSPTENELVFDTWYETNHEYYLWQLDPAKQYEFQVVATDFAGQQAVSDVGAIPGVTALIGSDPPADGTLCKTQNNVIRLTFDEPIVIGPYPLSIFGGGWEEGELFSYTVEPDGLTLKAVELGPMLTNLTWYHITPTADLPVAPFAFDLCVLQGDANDSGRVTTADYSVVKQHMGEYTDSRCDLNGSTRVTTADYSVVKHHMAERAPAKP